MNRVQPKEEFDGPLHGPDGWKLCTAPSLRGHIVNTHLNPLVLTVFQLPLYDIEAARRREFDLDWVVTKAVGRLALSDSEVREISPTCDPALYRHRLAQTLKLIDDRELSTVDWAAVDAIYPGGSLVTVDTVGDVMDRRLPF